MKEPSHLLGRIINAGLGCVTGLFFLITSRGGEWALPLALVGDRPALHVCDPRAGLVAAGADHGRPGHRRGPDASF